MPVHTHLKTPRRMDWQSVEHWPINLDASFPFTFFNLSADTYLQNVFLHRCLFCMNRCLSTSISWTVCCISTGEGGNAVKEIFLFLWRISIVVFRICYVVQFDKFNFNLEILYLWCVSIGEVCTWCISIGIFCICDAFWLVEEMQQLRMQSRGSVLWMHWLPTIGRRSSMIYMMSNTNPSVLTAQYPIAQTWPILLWNKETLLVSLAKSWRIWVWAKYGEIQEEATQQGTNWMLKHQPGLTFNSVQACCTCCRIQKCAPYVEDVSHIFRSEITCLEGIRPTFMSIGEPDYKIARTTQDEGKRVK